MKRHGGKRPVSIRPSLLARCGWKHTHCRQFRIKRASKARPPLRPAAIWQKPGMGGGPIDGAQMTKQTQLRKRLSLNDFVQADRRQPAQCSQQHRPITQEGKQRSRCNAVRHGLTAETVIGALEDAEDYKAFEAAVIADYDAQSAVEREMVLRLASLLWRLRRATGPSSSH